MEDAKQQEIQSQIVENIKFQTKLISNQDYSILSLIPPDNQNRFSCDICLVIDISGSMQIEATTKNEKGVNEAHGLSILDLVIHSVKTIIETLEENDILSVVTFSSQANILFENQQMNKKGKQLALDKLKTVQADGQTNLWAGLSKGLDLYKGKQAMETIKSLFILTDGVPNIEPPRGNLPMLTRYIEQNQGLPCQINTFGFGYDLDSKLLHDIAVQGGGNYSFIPDSQFVGKIISIYSLLGTVFVHAIANTLSIMCQDIEIDIKLENIEFAPGFTFSHINKPVSKQQNVIRVGSLQFGQAKNIIIQHINNDQQENGIVIANISFNHPKSQQRVQIQFQDQIQFGQIKDEQDILLINYTRSRLLVHDMVQNSLDVFQKNKETIQDISNQLQNDIVKLIVNNQKCFQDLLKDVNGQIKEAFSRLDWFKKWGQHYLPSLVKAHLNQICNNFKDPGIQNYGGTLFQVIRDRADDIFCKMPAPEPQPANLNIPGLSKQEQLQLQQQYQPMKKQVNMKVYSNNRAPCFTGDSLVKIAFNKVKKVKDIKQGDILSTRNEKLSKVVCVVKTPINNVAVICNFSSGLGITPYHPIKINKTWVFPVEVVEPQEQFVDFVYSFVLDKNHTMIINDLECVTLGHNFRCNPVIQHDYFGSQKVIQDLSNMKGWEQGCVMIQGMQKGKDNTVIKLIEYKN